jgi:hypothetical protein
MEKTLPVPGTSGQHAGCPTGYVMAVKANQPVLHDDIRLLMDDAGAPADDVAEMVDSDHGRIETRRAEVINEEQARARKDNAPENLALLRRLALNIIKRNADKGSSRI